MSYTQRPGVFSSYTVYSSAGGFGTHGCAGLAAPALKGEKGRVYEFTRLNRVFEVFSSDTENSVISALSKIMFLNGISKLYCVSVGAQPTADDYKAAFDALSEKEDIDGIVCPSDDAEVLTLMAQTAVSCSQSGKERIAFGGIGFDETTADTAKALNCERLCLATPAVAFEGGKAKSAGYLAAALCAAVCSQPDPSANLNGYQAVGDFGFAAAIGEEDIEELLLSGVCVFESSASRAELIRAVTTKTADENGTADSSLRELSTMRIIDDVIPHLRRVLKQRLKGAKNTEATRDAVRSQIACELAAKKDAGIIEGYDVPAVYTDQADPTVCIAEVGFEVVYGLRRIYITAHITV